MTLILITTFYSSQLKAMSSCQKINLNDSPEDMVLIDDHLFISGTNLPPKFVNKTGRLYYQNITKKHSPIGLDVPFPIYPHGISAIKVSEVIRLFIINHSPQKDTIEIFDFTNETLKHIKTISSPILYNANDIVAIDSNRFFITHDHYYKNYFVKIFESLLRLDKGFISYFDGNTLTKIQTDLAFPNGIQFKDNFLYVTLFNSKKINKYQLKSQKLKLINETPLAYHPDNISIKNNHLTVAQHPNLFQLSLHALLTQEVSPSLIQKINLENDRIDTLYKDSGEELSAASIAIQTKNDILIGSIYNRYYLVCPLPLNL